MITIQGKGVSAGVGVGPLYFYRRATAEIKRYTVEDTEAEWHRFKGAQTGAIEQLGALAEQARKEAGDEAAMLFETHQMMAEDLDYEEAIENLITNEKLNAEAAVSDVAEQFSEMFAAMDDAYMQARAADVKDVSQRILGILCGVVQGGIASEVPVLLAADDLAPSETIQLDKTKILGFVTAGGSGSSHTAILARTMGIPAIVGLGDALKPEYEGRQAIADGIRDFFKDPQSVTVEDVTLYPALLDDPDALQFSAPMKFAMVITVRAANDFGAYSSGDYLFLFSGRSYSLDGPFTWDGLSSPRYLERLGFQSGGWSLPDLETAG